MMMSMTALRADSSCLIINESINISFCTLCYYPLGRCFVRITRLGIELFESFEKYGLGLIMGSNIWDIVYVVM